MNWKIIATSLGIQYVGRFVGLFISLASIGLVTRYLGVAEFGEYTTALAIASLVVTFSDFGFFWSTVQSFIREDGKLNSIRDILGIRVVVTFLLILLSLAIVLLGNFSPSVKQAYILLSIFIFASSVNNILIGIYQAEYRMLWPTIVELVARAINLAIIIIGITLGKPLTWLIVGVSIAAFTNLAINWIGLYKRQGPIWPRIFGVSWKKYYNSVALVGLVSLFSALFYKIDIAILSWLKNSVDVGIYGAAQKIIELTLMMQGLFLASLFPLLVKSFKESQEAFNSVMRRAIIISTAIGAPICIFGLFLASQVVGLIGGEQFLTASTLSYQGEPITTPVILTILLLFVMITYISSPFTTGVLASGQVKQLVKVNLLATLLNIGLNLWLIPHYSYLAAAVTTLLTEILILVINGTYFCYRYSFRPPLRDMLLVVFATAPGVFFLSLTETAPLILRMPIVSILYGISLTLFLPEIRTALPELLAKKTPV